MSKKGRLAVVFVGLLLNAGAAVAGNPPAAKPDKSLHIDIPVKLQSA